MEAPMSDDDLINHIRNVGNGIAQRINAAMNDSPIWVAVSMLAGRIVNAGNSLTALQDNALHDYHCDAATIARGAYDATLQALYILAGKDEAYTRAMLYLDFCVVDQVRFIGLIENGASGLAKRLRESKLRGASEPLIKAEYDRVKGRYEQPNGKLRRDWYRGTLDDLAIEAGYQDEYKLLQKYLSSAVHSSAYGTKNSAQWGDKFTMNLWMCWFGFRVITRCAEILGINLSNDESGLASMAKKSVFEMPA
jgi:hypothetical protein